MANFYSKELKINNEIIVIECRRWRSPGMKWSIKVSSMFNGRDISHDEYVNKHFIKNFIHNKGVTLCNTQQC